jgi:hypothetical protein
MNIDRTEELEAIKELLVAHPDILRRIRHRVKTLQRATFMYGMLNEGTRQLMGVLVKFNLVEAAIIEFTPTNREELLWVAVDSHTTYFPLACVYRVIKGYKLPEQIKACPPKYKAGTPLILGSSREVVKVIERNPDSLSARDKIDYPDYCNVIAQDGTVGWLGADWSDIREFPETP